MAVPLSPIPDPALFAAYMQALANHNALIAKVNQADTAYNDEQNVIAAEQAKLPGLLEARQAAGAAVDADTVNNLNPAYAAFLHSLQQNPPPPMT